MGARRQVYDVRYDRRAGLWRVRGPGVNLEAATRAEAIAEARTIGNAILDGGRLAQVRIWNRTNGRISTEHTYGLDPRRTRG